MTKGVTAGPTLCPIGFTSKVGGSPGSGKGLAVNRAAINAEGFAVAEIGFELEYTDRVSGETVCVEVLGFQRVRSLAKELAKASGRRAIVRRKKLWLWSVHIANFETGESEVLWKGLTKHEALLRWRLWRERRTDCVLLPWPEWVAPLRLVVELA